MSVKDLEYVELITGISLDEDKPLSEVKRAQSTRAAAPTKEQSSTTSSRIGASIEPPKSDYDWFQFFLSCDVPVGLCERYAQAFTKDSMDESVLPDVDTTVLRNLGIREGDIIKIMRYLDKRFNRDPKKRAGNGEDEGGLFSGPGGTLRNNTRKGRPAPATQTSDTVDPKAFSQQKEQGTDGSAPSPSATRPKGGESGFDDDAWDVKPSKQAEAPAKAAPTPEPEAKAPTPEAAPPPTGALLDLSLLSKPLEPVKAQSTASPQVVQPPPQPAPPQQPAATAAQPPGASPAFFAGLSQQQTGLQNAMPTGPTGPSQPLNLGLGGARQRPMAPQMTAGQGGLVPPPPARPLSAPQSAQPSSFAPPPLQPQMTGMTPPGQSLNDLNQQRMTQQYTGAFQPQPTSQGMIGFNSGMGMAPQPTGFGTNQFGQPGMIGPAQPMQSPFSDPRPQSFAPIQNQPTGFQGGFTPGQQFPPPGGNVNAYLPPSLEPQRTGMPPMQTQQTGFGGGFGQGFAPGMNNNTMVQAQPPPAAPLVPQQTGPAPPVRFGVADKIAPQATGRRANLAQASK